MSTVESLTFSMICTRSDTTQVVKAVSMTSLGRDHWTIENWILHHLRDTIDRISLYDMDADNARG